MFKLWNVDRAAPAHHEAVPYRRAIRLADLLEQRTGAHITLVRV